MFNQYEGTLSDICSCGRLASRVHCPQCGVYSVYARSHKKNTVKIRKDGTEADLQTYQCRRCGSVFDEDDWKVNCHAAAPLRRAPGAAQGRVFDDRISITKARDAAVASGLSETQLPIALSNLAADPDRVAPNSAVFENLKEIQARRAAKEAQRQAATEAAKSRNPLEWIKALEKEFNDDGTK